jgi:hypothetical protein
MDRGKRAEEEKLKENRMKSREGKFCFSTF